MLPIHSRSPQSRESGFSAPHRLNRFADYPTLAQRTASVSSDRLSEARRRDGKKVAASPPAWLLDPSSSTRRASVSSTPRGFPLRTSRDAAPFPAPRAVVAFSESVRAAPVSRFPLLRDQAAPFAHFSLPAMGTQLLKSSVFALVNRTTLVTRRVEELDEKDELPPDLELSDIFSPMRREYELNIWHGFGSMVRFLSIRDYSALSLLRIFEHIAVATLNRDVAQKLVKSATESAKRKALKYTGVNLFGRIMRTTMYSQILPWAAYWVITLATIQMDPYARSQVPFKRRFLRVGMVSCVGLLATSLGASLGSMVQPGVGTMLGIAIMPNVAMFYVSDWL